MNKVQAQRRGSLAQAHLVAENTALRLHHIRKDVYSIQGPEKMKKQHIVVYRGIACATVTPQRAVYFVKSLKQNEREKNGKMYRIS